ncbi:heart- and neural crest derivatives-expressed protein 2 [Drosophila obscura]|uniref:heart- and neural crest derivatives-expressed protein 2 n=1 Tax=Drosophila obscura TaxID=7282 RepID=UPI001BB23613|nr:heart- and neural crest derivatives-expressed protein 2 [Drosophila obscura]
MKKKVKIAIRQKWILNSKDLLWLRSCWKVTERIKTLKLAILYINYLEDLLDGDQDEKGVFLAELNPAHHKTCCDQNKCLKSDFQNIRITTNGRTGWPQDVWASELNPDQN